MSKVKGKKKTTLKETPRVTNWGLDIFCCKKSRVTHKAKTILYIVMYVTYKVCDVGQEVKL